MTQQEKDEKRRKISKGAASGATAIIFLIIGFQAAVFVLKVLERPADTAEGPTPNTVIPEESAGQYPAPAGGYGTVSGKHKFQTAAGGHVATYPSARSYRDNGNSSRGNNPGRGSNAARGNNPGRVAVRRKVESFRFNPNTVTLEELVRLGLSEKQAGAILNYREKGGKFRKKEDFKKMYTVSDSLYQRLEAFIEIPKTELNGADSTALVALRGIGPYYARKIIQYREALGGYYCKEQLLEIRGIDSSRFEGLAESVEVDASKVLRFGLDTISEERMAAHPYIGKVAAKAIARLRELEIVTDSILVKESILEQDDIKKLRNYIFFEKKDTTD